MTFLNSSSKRRRAFLAVIIIIILAGAIFALLKNRAGIKTPDTRRQADIDKIYAALVLYYKNNGYLPVTSAYGENNTGGWDYSSQGQFLPFLQTAKYLVSVPLDPLNNGTGDVFYGGSGYSYAYYCYADENSLSLGLKLENGNIFWKADHEKGFKCK